MLNLLKTHFGFEQFLPWQEEIIRRVIAKKGSFVLMPAGGGKLAALSSPTGYGLSRKEDRQPTSLSVGGHFVVNTWRCLYNLPERQALLSAEMTILA